jgi:hypothetical protein
MMLPRLVCDDMTLRYVLAVLCGVTLGGCFQIRRLRHSVTAPTRSCLDGEGHSSAQQDLKVLVEEDSDGLQ